jgi:hypothetical protein
MKKLLFAAMLLCSIVTMAQQQASPMKPGRTADGIIYYLPKTAIKFTLLVEKKTYKPGPFAKYSEKFLRLRGIGQEEEVTYSLGNFSFTQVGIIDSTKCYYVKTKGGKCENADIKLSEDGMLLAINDEPAKPKEEVHFKPAPKVPQPDPKQFLNAEVLSAGSTAKMAELTVDQIIELQERRQALITGEAEDIPQDEQQLQLMIDEIDKQREILLTLFRGTVERDTTEHTVIVCPEKEMDRQVIFRLSKKLGLVDKDDLSGIPYYLSIENLNRTSEEQYTVDEKKREGGFYLNVPGRVKMTFDRENHRLAQIEIYEAQFGFVQLRAGSLFKRYVTHVVVNPIFGSVDKIKFDMNSK